MIDKDAWKYRRRFMAASIGFCMGTIVYCLVRDTDTTVAQTAVSWAFITISSTVGAYVFGAAWDDHSARQYGGHRGGRRRYGRRGDDCDDLPGTERGRGEIP